VRDTERDVLQIILPRALHDEVCRLALSKQGGFHGEHSWGHKCMILARTIHEYLLWYLILFRRVGVSFRLVGIGGDSAEGLAILCNGERMGTLSGRG
jgi:hypothetical protein